MRIELIFLNLAANFKGDLEKARKLFTIAIPTGCLWIRQYQGRYKVKGKGKIMGRLRTRLSNAGNH